MMAAYKLHKHGAEVRISATAPETGLDKGVRGILIQKTGILGEALINFQKRSYIFSGQTFFMTPDVNAFLEHLKKGGLVIVSKMERRTLNFWTKRVNEDNDNKAWIALIRSGIILWKFKY